MVRHIICAIAVASSTAAAPPLSVSCVGDSITAGNSYAVQLGPLLGPGYNVTNQGVSGHTMLNGGLCGATPGGSWRHPCLARASTQACAGNCSYWGTPQFRDVLSTAPDIITIMLGTNDAKGCNWDGAPNGSPPGAGTQFAADYVRMLRLFKALPSAPRVFVVLPPPGISQCSATGPAGNTSTCLAYNMSFTAINEVFPVLQRRIAADGGADGVVDVWSALNGSSCTSQGPGHNLEGPPCPHTVDGIHPYSDAHAVIAQTVASAILAAAPPPRQTLGSVG